MNKRARRLVEQQILAALRRFDSITEDKIDIMRRAGDSDEDVAAYEVRRQEARNAYERSLREGTCGS